MVFSVFVDNLFVFEILDLDLDIQFKNILFVFVLLVGLFVVNWYLILDLFFDGSGGIGKLEEFVFNIACKWISFRNNILCKFQRFQKEIYSEEGICKWIDFFN